MKINIKSVWQNSSECKCTYVYSENLQFANILLQFLIPFYFSWFFIFVKKSSEPKIPFLFLYLVKNMLKWINLLDGKDCVHWFWQFCGDFCIYGLGHFITYIPNMCK